MSLHDHSLTIILLSFQFNKYNYKNKNYKYKYNNKNKKSLPNHQYSFHSNSIYNLITKISPHLRSSPL